MSATLPWVALTCASLLVLLVSELRQWALGNAIAKPLASAGYVATAVAAGALTTPYGRVVLVALALCWWGDVFLLSRARKFFLAGLGSFLAGHLAFGCAFVVRELQPLWTAAAAVGLILLGYAVGRWLLPKVDERMRPPVMAYIAVISLMVALAFGTVCQRGNFWILIAAVAFYVSDLAVARDRFVSRGFVNRLVGVPLYYSAQILFGLSTH